MLGDKIGEGSGTITVVRALAGSQRVISPGGDNPELEVSFQGTGTLLGVGVTWCGSYAQIIRPGGVLHGLGEVTFLTQDGGACLWRGFGVGTPTGPGFSASFGVCGHFDSAPQNLAGLLRTANVVEYEIEENGNVRWQAWEWSGATKSVSLPSDESVSVRT